LTKDDDLAALLGEDKYLIDSIAVKGFLSHANVAVLDDCGYKGKLKKIDMSGCVIENDSIPVCGFYFGRWTDIKLPQNLRIIGKEAFYRCHIKNIEFPSTLRRIDYHAFDYVQSLESIIIPEGVVEIGEGAFYGCLRAKEVQLPSSLKRINEDAFGGCGDKAEHFEIKFKEGLEFIGNGAFCSTGVTDVELPSTVVELGMAAFSHCQKLQRVKLPENLEKIQLQTFLFSNISEIIWPKKLKELEWQAFGNILMNCLELPEGLTTIGYDIFRSTVTEKLILPTTLQSLHYSAFISCTAIKEVYAKSAVPPVLNNIENTEPFPRDAVLYVPVGAKEAYQSTFCKGEFKDIIETGSFPTAIDGMMTDDITYNVCGTNGAITIVNNGGAPVSYHIYTADGKLYNSGVASTGMTKAVAAHGTYIVRVGRNSSKVFVR